MDARRLTVEILEDGFRIYVVRADDHQWGEDHDFFDRTDELAAAVDVLVAAVTDLEREHGR